MNRYAGNVSDLYMDLSVETVREKSTEKTRESLKLPLVPSDLNVNTEPSYRNEFGY